MVIIPSHNTSSLSLPRLIGLYSLLAIPALPSHNHFISPLPILPMYLDIVWSRLNNKFIIVTLCLSSSPQSSCLQSLDISRTSWSEHSVPILCRAIRADTCLLALHLEACNLAGRPLVLLSKWLLCFICQETSANNYIRLSWTVNLHCQFQN